MSRAQRPIDHPELDGMPERRQITRRIGLASHLEPEVETIKLSGTVTVLPHTELPELNVGDDITVTVAGPDGQVLGVQLATLIGGGFEVQNSGQMSWLEKQWKARP